MVDIEFFTNPQSRGLIVHWMLEELGEPYETFWIEYGEQMKGPAYLAINPMGKVPAIRHKGVVVTECPAICTYLAQVYPARSLIPTYDAGLATFYRWMFFAAGPMELITTIKGMKWEPPEGADRTLGFGSEKTAFDAIEHALAGNEFICGEQFTAADVYFGSHLMWGLQFGAVEKRQVFTDYAARLMAREAYKNANALCEARVAETASG